MVNLEFLAAVNDVIVGDDVTIKGDGEPASRGSRHNLIGV